MSLRSLAGLPPSTSGAMYIGVPVSDPPCGSSIRRPAPMSVRTIRPPRSRMTLRALISRCSSPVACTEESAREIDANQQGFLDAKNAVACQLFVERLPIEQFHPDAGRAIVDVGPENFD